MINRLVVNDEVLMNIYISDGYAYKTGNIGVDLVDVAGSTRKVFKRVNKTGVEDTIPVLYRNSKGKTYEEVIDELVEVLDFGSGESVKIGFTDSNYHSVGYFMGVIEIDAKQKVESFYEIGLEVTYTEPYKYSNELKVKEFGNSVTVNNSKEPVEPVMRLTATKSSQYLRLFNNKTKGTLLVGEDDISPTKQEEIRVYTMQGLNGLVGENTHGNHVVFEDGILKPIFDNLGGTLRYRHNLDTSLEDFSQVITFRTMGVEPGQRSNSYIHYYDKDGNVVVALDMVVNPNTQNPNLRGKAHVWLRVLNKEGTGLVTLREFSGDDYNRVFDDADLSVRVTRRGNRIDYKTWKYSRRDGALTGRNTMRWNNLSNRVITHFKVGFTKQRHIPTSELGIGKLEIDEVINGNSPHYDIVQEGDEIVINNDIDLITRNGEPIVDLKEITSDYITLDRGSNRIDLRPTGTFEGVIEYRERKL